MRIVVLIMLAIAAISVPSSARAQNYDPKYPVCMQVIQNFGGQYNECAYYTMEQCAQRAAGLAATCIMNPFYRGRR
ncbi:MAG: DUF3551 domain-containing protein [Bradyrhizobium sp.]